MYRYPLLYPFLTHTQGVRERERSRSEHCDTKEERERRLKGGKEREGLQRMQPTHLSVGTMVLFITLLFFIHTHTQQSFGGKTVVHMGEKKRRGVEINKE